MKSIPQPYRRARKNPSAIEAKFEAQKLAFAPLAFQATRAMRNLGILEALYNCEDSLSVEDICQQLKLSEYTVSTLLEVGDSLGLVLAEEDGTYSLGKVGDFILNDEMTRINMDFVNDVCYQGAFALQESFVAAKPLGLKVFGEWDTIYQGLSKLPEKAQKSWFAFDHYYSDIAFPKALPIVFANSPKHIFDIGGNTGKWALQCLKYNSDVEVSIFDLAGQLAKAEENITKAGLQERSHFCTLNMLDAANELPSGADVIWMSQFLDCFSKEQIVAILRKVAKAASPDCSIYILEPFLDMQKFKASTYSLNHTSLYFTCMANGNSKMYSFKDMEECIIKAGLRVAKAHHDLGDNAYSLLECRIS
jgi:hypothetical protein